jgi:hypothetical protein
VLPLRPPAVAALLGLVALALLAAAGSPGQGSSEARWSVFVQAPEVVDVVGPRRDGRLVVGTRRGSSCSIRTIGR